MGALEKNLSFEKMDAPAEARVYLSGIQALVRLPMLQRESDRARGLNTAGLVSGYRGSPLGAYDQQLWRAKKELAAHDIVFQPGLNEDLAATALWGAQMHRAYGPTKNDGVFGIWYGKGPGVDRSGDVFRAANMLGTSPFGGVLAIPGDDHAAQSSMFPHQTDGIFQSVSMPILQPASVREILELGLAGFAMSRYCGLWVALKTIAEVVETAASFELAPLQTYVTPSDFVVPPHGLNWDPRVTWPSQRNELERRLINERLPAARAWARANQLDRTVIEAAHRRLGIVTVGKAHQDVMQALLDLELDLAELQRMGISIYKVAMSWPLETLGMSAFAKGQEELLIVEEKRSIVETQVKDSLYHWSAGERPRVSGKADASGAPLLPETLEFTPLIVARALVSRLGDAHPQLRERLAALESRSRPAPTAVIPIRRPYFCSGCPHNTSTKTPDGSIAGGGIGCHALALAQPELKTTVYSQMGGEGVQWVGAAPFSQTAHIFQNLGDGTYQHSGLLAIRAAIAAGANITYKILYNDAVAMTGGQPAEGLIEPARVTRQLLAEGVGRIAFVTDDPDRWKRNPQLAAGVKIYHRDALDSVQRELRTVTGVTAIVYEQTCAAEKRRRRKRADYPDPDKRLFINHRVCEGCGDCSVQSNCIAIEPIETAFGRKRAINQGACNKDYSCVKGFCPSFVEIEGVNLRKPDDVRLRSLESELSGSLQAPAVQDVGADFNIVVTGIGGTGVLTMGALLGAAAHGAGLGATVLDFTGLAQKNGAVVSQVRIAASAADLHAVRIGPGSVDLVLGADLVVSAGAESMAWLCAGRSMAIVNTGEAPTAEVVTQRDASLPTGLMLERIQRRCLAGRFHAFDASALAHRLFGDTLTVHTLMLGYAWQLGYVPLSKEAIEQAIELNGTAVMLNKRAFTWGRIAAAKPQVLPQLHEDMAAVPDMPKTLDGLVEHYRRELQAYQNEAYARRYADLVGAARQAEQRVAPGAEEFGRAVATSAYRLMAYKDEYEVARLYTVADFAASLSSQFSKARKISVWLAPPLLSRIDPATGRPKKRRFGPWVLSLFKVLARMRGLRGTALDIFGYTSERRRERELIAEYFEDVEALVRTLTARNRDVAVSLARLPEDIRGFGPVKEKAIEDYVRRKNELRAAEMKPIEILQKRAA